VFPSAVTPKRAAREEEPGLVILTLTLTLMLILAMFARPQPSILAVGRVSLGYEPIPNR
jgi:hypothetical protein